MGSASASIDVADRKRFERAESMYVAALIAFLKHPPSEKLRRQVLRAGTDEMRSHPAETKKLLPWLMALAVGDREAWAELLIDTYRWSPHSCTTLALRREIDTLKSRSPFQKHVILVFTPNDEGGMQCVNGDPVGRRLMATGRNYWYHERRGEDAAILMAFQTT